MPFKNARQEMAMRAKAPDVARRWAKKYGHAPGYGKAMKSAMRKMRS